jgi:BirA family transcriptional regulator, biotin operon repressor / biotin---[acetyl-CoA-carboxylase] ligase
MQETRRAVLDRIADGPVTGPALATGLGVSRTAIWNHVEALREAGFTIRSVESGYRLDGIPEYGGPAVEFGLAAPFSVDYHETVASTNARARDLAIEGAENVVVLADAQTGGRGRLDRGWDSPTGGIWLSVLCRPAIEPSRAPLYTLAAAVATTRAIRTTGVEAAIKWPNDLLVPAEKDNDENDGDESGERKLAGILTEMRGEADRLAWLVVGIGINANIMSADLPAGATSLYEQRGGENVTRAPLVRTLLNEFDGLRTDLGSVIEAWRTHTLTLGRRVRVETARESVVGRAIDITAEGALVIETPDGSRTVRAGDCEHLRPADDRT